MPVDDSAIQRMQSKINRLEAENRHLRKENKRLVEDKNSRTCIDCGRKGPDSPAFFGASFDDVHGRDRCGSCARAYNHESGLDHIRHGCPLCAKGVPYGPPTHSA